MLHPLHWETLFFHIPRLSEVESLPLISKGLSLSSPDSSPSVSPTTGISAMFSQPTFPVVNLYSPWQFPVYLADAQKPGLANWLHQAVEIENLPDLPKTETAPCYLPRPTFSTFPSINQVTHLEDCSSDDFSARGLSLLWTQIKPLSKHFFRLPKHRCSAFHWASSLESLLVCANHRAGTMENGNNANGNITIMQYLGQT